MRFTRLLAVGVLAFAGSAASVLANETSEVPWDEIDRVLKESDPPADRGKPDEDFTRVGAAKPAAEQTPSSPAPAREELIDDPEPVPAEATERPDAVPDPRPTAQPASPGNAAAPAATEAVNPVLDDDNAGGVPEEASTGPAPAPPPIQSTAAPAVPADAVTLPLATYFEDAGKKSLASYPQADRDAMAQFYAERSGGALWVTKTGYNADAKALVEELAKADDWGLRAGDYKVPAVVDAPNPLSEPELLEGESRLTLAAVAYSRHARGDRIEDPAKQLSSYLDRKPNLVDRKVFLQALAASTDKAAYLRGMNPKHEQFVLLRQKLLELRKGRLEAEVFEKIPNGGKITPGKSHPHISLIRKRLKMPAPGMKPDGTAADEKYYDDALAGAVIRFKEKNDITPANATITAELRKAMNGGTRVSEEAILANMEQWRWMPDDLGALHVKVNIPEFMVRVYKNGKVIHEERIISGKRETQTPIFSDSMSRVVLQPSWNVPDSIKINELLPGLRYGGNPVARQGLVIERNGRKLDAWDVDWYRADIRNYHIYQPPGPSNVLGVVKFLFPNKHAVYLHDTASKSLFNEKTRMFSHGCVRVRNPVRLAELILEADKGWDASTVGDVLKDGPMDNDIQLDKPIPVHVTYFTAWVGEDGELKMFSDFYGHEQRIKLALAGRWNQIEKNRDHLLPPDPSAVASRYRYGDDDWFEVGPNGRRYGYSNSPFWSYAEPPPKYYGKKKPPKGGGFFDQLFGGF